jgi:hypothetical protein
LVTSALIASSTEIVWPGLSPSFDGAWAAAWADTFRRVAGIQFLEQDIERHDLGEGGGIPAGVGIARIDDLAVVGINDDAGIFRSGIGLVGLVRDRGHEVEEADGNREQRAENDPRFELRRDTRIIEEHD